MDGDRRGRVHLGWVAVDDAEVLFGFGALDHQFLAVAVGVNAWVLMV